MSASWKMLEGDCRAVLAGLDAGSVHTCVTSPPYFGLRDYGHGEQIGLETKPEEFIEALVDVFRQVRRVLRDDGTVWLNLGDSYADRANRRSDGQSFRNDRADVVPAKQNSLGNGIKTKDLVGIPWAVAFALRADGWYLRSDIVWHKPNPMPESVRDRPTRSHEFIFLLSKGPRYFYDADAIREDVATERGPGVANGDYAGRGDGTAHRSGVGFGLPASGRNKRDVWTVATRPYSGAHFATFPPDLIEPCVLAGAPERACGACGAPWQRIARTEVDASRPAARQAAEVPEVSHNGDGRNGKDSATFGHWTRRVTTGFESSCGCDADTAPGVVLDPFAGAGTTGMVALRHGRSFVGVELNAEYAEMARERIRDDAPLLNGTAEAIPA